MNEEKEHVELQQSLPMLIKMCQRGKGKRPFQDMNASTFKTTEFRYCMRMVITVFQFLDCAEAIHTHLN